MFVVVDLINITHSRVQTHPTPFAKRFDVLVVFTALSCRQNGLVSSNQLSNPCSMRRGLNVLTSMLITESGRFFAILVFLGRLTIQPAFLSSCRAQLSYLFYRISIIY